MSRNPKKVVEAFAAAGAGSGSIELGEFTISSVILMEKIGCPLLSEKGVKAEDMTNLDVLRLVYILAHLPKESFRALRSGMDEFDATVIEFGGSISIGEVKVLGAKIRDLFAKAMSTAPAATAPESEAGPEQKKSAAAPTRSPSTSPARGTDSAGSSR